MPKPLSPNSTENTPLQTLLSEKVSTFQSMLAEAAGDTTLRVQDVFGSEKQNFRMRASFKMWREDSDVHYVMYNKQEEGRGPPQRSHQPSVDSGPASCGQESWRLLFILSGKTLVGARHMACLIKAA